MIVKVDEIRTCGSPCTRKVRGEQVLRERVYDENGVHAGDVDRLRQGFANLISAYTAEQEPGMLSYDEIF